MHREMRPLELLSGSTRAEEIRRNPSTLSKPESKLARLSIAPSRSRRPTERRSSSAHPAFRDNIEYVPRRAARMPAPGTEPRRHRTSCACGRSPLGISSAIIEARGIFDGVRGLAFHDADRRTNSPPRRDYTSMSVRSSSLRSGHDSQSLTIGKLGELTHKVCMLLGGVR